MLKFYELVILFYYTQQKNEKFAIHTGLSSFFKNSIGIKVTSLIFKYKNIPPITDNKKSALIFS